MDVSRLFLATLLVCLCFLSAYSHLAPEEKPRDERNLKNNSSMNLLDFPSVSIVALNKKSKKISRNEAEKKKRASKDFPGGCVVKNPPANAEDMGWILGSERPPHASEQLGLCASTIEPML
uniref:Uncharacterized protein n=2 Tax=Ovis aries TaxID=9940 RepID=A0AC11DNZ9_SHEEP